MNAQDGHTAARLLSLALVVFVALNLVSCRGVRRLSPTARRGTVTHLPLSAEQHPMPLWRQGAGVLASNQGTRNDHRARIAQIASGYRSAASDLRLAAMDADFALAMRMRNVAYDMDTLADELDKLANSGSFGYLPYTHNDALYLSQCFRNVGWSLQSLASYVKMNGGYLAGSELEEMADRHLQIGYELAQMAP